MDSMHYIGLDIHKKKNDGDDAAKIADLLRCNLLPECYMMPPNTFGTYVASCGFATFLSGKRLR